ncbi:VirB4 family type IV secretion/conjugal transfer ATPase [Asticcacaulis sp. W401b]|uniref:VirB4 family type IV secretion/conjugal transfer ATPase n=1 Tax=Asticcacaulis sp. W401b TaxID=3388666 RepID=UPI003970B2E3
MKPRAQLKDAVAVQVSASEYIPFGTHIAPDVIKLRRTGDYVATWKLAGISFETQDEGDIAAAKENLTNLLRGLNGGQVALWSHKLRRRVYERLSSTYDNAFACRLAADYYATFERHRQMRTELYLSVVWRPDLGKVPNVFGNLFGAAKRSLADIKAADSEALDNLEDVAKMVERALEPYRPERLTTYTKGNVVYSGLLAMYGYLVNGVWEEVPLRRASIDQYLTTSRLHFGDNNGRLQIVHPLARRFAGFLDIADYPKWTESGVGNAVLYADYEYIETQSFSILNRRDAQGALERQRGHMHAAEDASETEIVEITEALDDLVAGQIEVGEYHYSLAILTESAEALGKAMSDARAALQDQAGFKMSVIDVVPEAAWFAQLPGNWDLRPREAKLTSRNFAGLSPFHNFDTGKRLGNPWGEALALFQTPSGQPYYFNFHVSPPARNAEGEALPGNTFICGTTGSGKTVLQTALLAFSLKYPGLRAVCFDKDRGMEIGIRALGGQYRPLERGTPTGFNPFQLEPTEENIQFCEKLVRLLVGGELTAREENEISEAVRTTMGAHVSRDVRCLSLVCQNLSVVGENSLQMRLRKWLRGQSLGWVFDNDRDTLDFSNSRLYGFDYTEFLDDPEIRTPVMAYLLHTTEALIDGAPFLYIMEEFWKPLMDSHFSDFALNKQKTIRKQNGLGVFVTQSPSDVLTHLIGKTMVEQSVTQIYLPNPRADRADYVDGFKVTEAEFEVIRSLGETSRTFLVKQGKTSAICRFDLGGLTEVLNVISGTTENVALLDGIRETHGDDPDVWLPVFLDRLANRTQQRRQIA